MKFRLEIECDNDAFQEPQWTNEVSRILHDVAGRVRIVADFARIVLKDIKGNTVGYAEVIES